MKNKLSIVGSLDNAAREILSDDALAFLNDLVEKFAARRDALLDARVERQKGYDSGGLPDFLPDTSDVRESDWFIRGIPADLLDRRVEITGPVDRKMVINALNADVKVFMADFEDSLAPSWANLIDGQFNLRDAAAGTISFDQLDTGKHYELNENPAVLIARVRGLHLPENHIEFDGKPIPGALMDFALYFHHNHKTLLDKGSGPYFYIPKLQSHLEARWWDQVFAFAEDRYGLDRGAIKITVLIETLPAAFEMDEILYELRDHIVALNCGRWDYIFSYIKTLKMHADRVLPDRQEVTMENPFLSAYSRLLIRTCHRRGALAMGGMAAYIPSRDPDVNAMAMEKVRADKELEAGNGHDGTWIAHPGLAGIANEIFDAHIPAGSDNQLAVTREDDAPISADELLAAPAGHHSEAGMRSNIRIAVQYLEAWLQGNGCVPIYNLMEDAATAEISRASIWQWIRHGTVLDNGETVTRALFRTYLAEELGTIREEVGAERFDGGRFDDAARIMDELTTSDELTDFLTLITYPMI